MRLKDADTKEDMDNGMAIMRLVLFFIKHCYFTLYIHIKAYLSKSLVSYIYRKMKDVLLSRFCRCRSWCCVQDKENINITSIYDRTISIKVLVVQLFFLYFKIVSPSLALYVCCIAHMCMYASTHHCFIIKCFALI